MKKIIIKSALITLGIVFGCAAVVFAVLSLGFPGTMAGWCEQVGNYGFAAKYAALYYSYTGDVADLARCADDAVLSEKDDYIIEYCSQLVERDDFDAYCNQRDEAVREDFPLLEYSYRQYMYGCLAGAHYSSGDLRAAIGCSSEALIEGYSAEDYSLGDDINGITSFPANNALGALSLRVIEAGDSDAADYILPILRGVEQEGNNYLETLIAALSQL